MSDIVTEALEWAWTNAMGRLPDANTMTEDEIKQYWRDYENILEAAIRIRTGELRFKVETAAGKDLDDLAEVFRLPPRLIDTVSSEPESDDSLRGRILHFRLQSSER